MMKAAVLKLMHAIAVKKAAEYWVNNTIWIVIAMRSASNAYCVVFTIRYVDVIKDFFMR